MNAQGKRKSLTDDSLRVESVGKVFAGQLLAYYPWCALFEISGCLTSLCGIRDIIYSYYIYHHMYFMLRVYIVVRTCTLQDHWPIHTLRLGFK